MGKHERRVYLEAIRGRYLKAERTCVVGAGLQRMHRRPNLKGQVNLVDERFVKRMRTVTHHF